ncbi:PREDICTED: transcription factor EMB1444-like isoform X2 [Nelumbo nucifera]|uniref:Transcription factor EMB1444-like isoform X2 n=1 Tax=Nelumbo nucifera TaxID=4432 RepID=A0A1U8AIJ4_NELNU|nr:PREDICTED: transcription factor EMB1444-like isoform X2 [Nelumbo nucifera]
MSSLLKEELKSLCCSNRWSYGVFWRINHPNSIIIGEAAFTGKNRWLFSDTYYREYCPQESVDNQNAFQDSTDFHHQFSSGVKTIVVIAVTPQGVLQFGSTEKVQESSEFVDHAQNLFGQIENRNGIVLSGDVLTSLNSEICHQSGSFASMAGLEAQALLQSTCNSTSNFIAKNTTMSTWNGESLTTTLIEQRLLTGMGIHGSSNMPSVYLKNPVPCRNAFQNFQGDSDTGLLQVNRPIVHGSGKLVDLPHASEVELSKTSTSFPSFPWDSFPSNATKALSKPNPGNSTPQWDSPPFEQVNGELDAKLNENLSQSPRLVSVSSGFTQSDVFNSISENHVDTSVNNSINDTINSPAAVSEWKESSPNVPMQVPIVSKIFDSSGLDFGYFQGQECWDDILVPLGRSNNSSLSTFFSGCIPELDVGSINDCKKGLLSEFGLKQMLSDACDSNSVVRTALEDQLSTSTVTRTGSTSQYGNQVQLAGLSYLGRCLDAMVPGSTLEKIAMHRTQQEVISKSQAVSWVDDSYNIHTESVVSQHKRPGEPAKVIRKRAQPGESTRPRPKDRQQIQDRVKELREIVPNGEKCSIDALLDRTIKHMLFLQSVTKYANKLKQVNDPKMIGEENGVVLRDNSCGSDGGATWAFEVGGQTMVCPITVEDLNPPDQMLVEMLCEEQGFFLEIADIIQGFGLTILKGLMEVQEDKIWARFVVEANRDLTRMDIFLFLVEFLQQMTSGIGPNNESNKAVDTGAPLFINCQQAPMPLRIGLADRMQ